MVLFFVILSLQHVLIFSVPSDIIILNNYDRPHEVLLIYYCIHDFMILLTYTVCVYMAGYEIIELWLELCELVG